MREPKLYGPLSCNYGRNTRWQIEWYDENGRRGQKSFNSHARAELFYRAKCGEVPANDAQVLLLEKINTIDKAVSEFVRRQTATEAENARLRDELAEAKNRRDGSGVLDNIVRSNPIPAARSDFKSNVLLLRPELEALLGTSAAIVFQQLVYLINQSFGKILPDGRRYIYNTLDEWKTRYFQSWCTETIARAFRKLETAGYVHSEQPEGRCSRRKYYTLTPEGDKLSSSAHIRGTKGRDGNPTKCGPENTTDCRRPNTENENSTDAAAEQQQQNSCDLIRRVQEQYPRHDVAAQFLRYSDYRKKHGLLLTANTFKRWMKVAEIPLPPPVAGKNEPKSEIFEKWWRAKDYGKKNPCPPWRDAPPWARDEFRREQKACDHYTSPKLTEGMMLSSSHSSSRKSYHGRPPAN